jgi:hypothetical protein
MRCGAVIVAGPRRDSTSQPLRTSPARPGDADGTKLWCLLLLVLPSILCAPGPSTSWSDKEPCKGVRGGFVGVLRGVTAATGGSDGGSCSCCHTRNQAAHPPTTRLLSLRNTLGGALSASHTECCPLSERGVGVVEGAHSAGVLFSCR